MQLKIDNIRQQNYYRQLKTTPNTQPSFGCFKPSRKMIEWRSDFASKIADKLNMNFTEVNYAIEGKSKKRLLFLDSLAERYNRKYFYAEKKENPQNVMDIFESISKPNRSHFGIINCVHGSFEHLGNIFRLSKDANTMKFVREFDNNVFNHRRPSQNIIIDLLNSPNRNEYINNIQEYKSYLNLNRKNDNAIKELDELIKAGQYDRTKYDIQFSVDNLFEGSYRLRETFDKQDIVNNYSGSGRAFLEEFFEYYYARRDFSILESNKEQLMDMFKTTTPKNVDLRIAVLDRFRYKFEADEKATSKEINAIHAIFEKIDKSNDTKEFVQHLMNQNLDIESAQELNNIIDLIPPKKANIFNRNIIRIISQTQAGEERNLALQKEVTNPFYLSEATARKIKMSRDYMISGQYHKESKFNKFLKKVANKLNVLRYNRAIKKEPDILFVKPSIEIKSNETKSIEIISTPIVETQEKALILPLVKTSSKAPNAKKLLIINDVKDIISKKLGAKTLEEQEVVYGKNATKMRLKLLPEIFASIKETRAADRAAGKLKSNSSNKDAVLLYNRINGHNRKLVRYLLMKRNVDGTRMFEVKDIISFLDKANNKVAQAKVKNPNLRAENVKAYYEHLYQAKIEQYGKLSTKRSH